MMAGCSRAPPVCSAVVGVYPSGGEERERPSDPGGVAED